MSTGMKTPPEVHMTLGDWAGGTEYFPKTVPVFKSSRKQGLQDVP